VCAEAANLVLSEFVPGLVIALVLLSKVCVCVCVCEVVANWVLSEFVPGLVIALQGGVE